ncbi:hypothetical protein FACS1894167_15680 [Synergistales bacterium]|nr:hypothetical protein FACS1894167_15680 [Synergistales bacterium]
MLILEINGDISHKMIYAGFDGSFLSDPLMGLAVKEGNLWFEGSTQL